MKTSSKIVILLMGLLLLIQVAIGMVNLAEGQHVFNEVNRNLRLSGVIK